MASKYFLQMFIWNLRDRLRGTTKDKKLLFKVALDTRADRVTQNTHAIWFSDSPWYQDATWYDDDSTIRDMARLTREQSRQRTRERLLDAAQEVFAREGYTAASCEQIAEHAEFSKGAIYSNFAGKEALFLELLARNMDREKRTMRHIAAECTSAQEILDALVRQFALIEDKLDGCLLVTEFQMEAGRREGVAKPFAQLFRAHRRELAKLLSLASEMARRKLKEEPEILALFLFAQVGGLALQRAADPRSVPIGMLTRSVRFFLDGVFRA